jgi:hypothetical protein
LEDIVDGCGEVLRWIVAVVYSDRLSGVRCVEEWNEVRQEGTQGGWDG